MFLTITIDTTQKTKKTVAFNKSKVSAQKGFIKARNGKKISIFRKMRNFIKSLKASRYRLGRAVIGY